MIVKCNNCSMYFDDEYRNTICPHEAFPANDGLNNFEVHEDAYLSDKEPNDSSIGESILKDVYDTLEQLENYLDEHK